MGAPRTVTHVLVTLAVTATLASCAGRAPGGPVSAVTDPAAPPTGTIACAMVEGVELPPECIPVDVEANMALNDAYRQRMDVSADQVAAAEPERAAVEAALTGLVDTLWTGASVADALTAAGIDEDRASVVSVGDRDAPEQVEVIVSSTETAVCIVGQIDADGVEVASEGMIGDGGCVPAQ